MLKLDNSSNLENYLFSSPAAFFWGSRSGFTNLKYQHKEKPSTFLNMQREGEPTTQDNRERIQEVFADVKEEEDTWAFADLFEWLFWFHKILNIDMWA